MDGSAPDVSIVTSGHDVADARIHRWCAALADAGLTVELLGLGSEADAPGGVPTSTADRPGPASRARLAGTYAARARGRVLLALDPDSLLATLAVGRARRRAVVADVHEDYAALLRDRAWARGAVGAVAAGLAGVASRAARTADLVVVADAHIPPLEARRRVVLRNLPYLGMLPVPGPAGDPLRALYVGDVRPSRGLWSMLDAVAAARAWHLDVVGPVAPSAQPELAARLAAGDLADRVSFHGRRPPREAWSFAAGAACGLVLLEDTPAFREAMPSKLYEYVASGLPVVVTDLPRQREFVESRRIGVVVPAGTTTGTDTAAVLRGWTERRSELAELRARTADFRAEADAWSAEYAAAAAAVRDLVVSVRRS
jgi:glycosyltransferase involved in cell wall biosynthesis